MPGAKEGIQRRRAGENACQSVACKWQNHRLANCAIRNGIPGLRAPRDASSKVLQPANNPHWRTFMAKRKNGVNKSEEIRKVLRENPRIKAKEVISTLADRGITVTDTLVYLVKRSRRGRRKKAREAVATVAATGNSDPLTTIRKIKQLANDVGGLKKLKALVDALSE